MTNSKLNNPGIIYFVQEKDLLGYSTPNYVKIGLVKDNEIGRSGEDRKDEHQTGNPRPLYIAHSITTKASVSKLESLIHQKLSLHRHRGEWFVKPNGEIDPFIKESNLINEKLQNQLKNDLKIEELNSQFSSGEITKPSSEAQDIHNVLLRVIKEKKEIETQKKIIELKLRLLSGSSNNSIEGVFQWIFKRESQRFDARNFEKENPELFEKYAKESQSSIFRIQKVNAKINKELIDELNSKVSLLDSCEKSTKVERSSEAEDLHREWLTFLSQQQPLELKRENLVNKLKILCDENSGIENICSWKREPIKKINKSDLQEVDKDIVNKYLVKVKSTSSFMLNNFRAYKFK